nr:NB-ARC domain-containing protein [Actinokineospora fastidiosa]
MTALTAAADAAHVVVLTHPAPGIGKTALAVHWAHTAAERYPDGQLYVDLRGSNQHGITRQAADVAHDVLIAFGADPHPGADARLAQYRTLLAEKRVLLVLDDARDADQVRPLLPPGSRSLVVVTSRHDLVTLGAPSVRPTELDPVDSADLLTALAVTDPAAARALVHLCAGLPAALIAAAGAGPADRIAAELWATPEIGSEPDPAARAQRVVAWARSRGGRTWAEPLAAAAWLADRRLLIGAGVALCAAVLAVSTEFIAASGLLGVLYFLLRFGALGVGLALLHRPGPAGALGAGLSAGSAVALLVDALVSINFSGQVLVWLELLAALVFATLLWVHVQPVRTRPRGLRLVPPARRPLAFAALGAVSAWFILLFVAIDLDEYTSATPVGWGGALGMLLPVATVGGLCALAALTEIPDEVHRVRIGAAVVAYLAPELVLLTGTFALGDRFAYVGGGLWTREHPAPAYSAVLAAVLAVVLLSALTLLRLRQPGRR